jgi:putative transposase
MKLNKSYKLRLYPNKKQQQYFEQNFGNARFIYNKMLEDKIKYYKKTKEMLHNTPAQYKEEFEFLKKSDSLALSNAQLALERAYRMFFRNPKKFGFPKFKSKHKSKFTYTTNNQNGTIFIENGKIKLPKIGFIKIVQHREFIKGSIIKSVTISRTKTNKYFASILTEYEKEIKQVQPETFSGLDYSMSDFFVDSEGNKGNYPKFYRLSHERLAKEQRKLSKMQKGSNNYNKQRIKIAKVYEKIANQRKDFLHKTSRKIANSYDVVCVENLNMQAMSQTFRFGKSVHDNGWGMFVNMLEYKLFEMGKFFIEADKYFPSTKQCSSCGEKKEMPLSLRTYECPSCGLKIDRDLNAALNLKQYGVNELGLT